MVIKFINCARLLCFNDGLLTDLEPVFFSDINAFDTFDGLFLLRQYTEKIILLYINRKYIICIYREIEKVRHFRQSPS